MNNRKVHQIPLTCIHTGKNDRTIFKQDDIESLAASIKERGLIQPITVNLFAKDPRCVFGGDPFGDAAQFDLIAGERRFRAVQLLGWETIDAFVAELTDEEAAAVMLSENTARVDLDPVDEARAYEIRVKKYGWSHAECAKAAGVSEIVVRNRLKLLTLRDDLHILIRSGNLSIGYAQILADAKLDKNRQSLAFNALRDNPKPTPGWFRNVVNQYSEQQNTVDLFDTGEFLKCQVIPEHKINPSDPPHPSTTTPPKEGKNIKDIIKNQIRFWHEAADKWQAIGKPFKKQECLAAALALQYTLN
jgi:ParB family transcriptional regulator, chromosome partitioning protein